MSWPGQRAALEALRQAVLVADLDAWRAHLGRGPLAWFARRRVRRALLSAARQMGLTVEVTDQTRLQLGHEPDPVGARVALLQAAWLVAAGRSRAMADQFGRTSVASVLMTEAGSSATIARRAELASVYWEALQSRARPSRKWPYLVVAAAAIVGLVVFSATAGNEVEVAPTSTDTTHLAPEREAAWVEALSDWVVALDRQTRLKVEGALSADLREAADNLAAHEAAILAEPLPPPVLEAMQAALTAGTNATRAGDDWEAREEAFAEAVRHWNRTLREAGLGYFFDAYAALYPGERGEVGLFSFRVDTLVRYQQVGNPGPSTVDALHLRRIDRLNLVQYLLGYTSRRMDVAVVLLDKLEHQLATRIGLSLVPQAEMPLQLEGDAPPDWDKVRARSGQLVREAFYAAFPQDIQALTELGELLTQRAALFTAWNERLSRRGIILQVPDELEVTADYLSQLEGALGAAARAELVDLQDRLTVQSSRRFFARLLQRHASSVERHEVQHRLDYADPDFVAPTELTVAMGLQDSEDTRATSRVERAAAELSAYTAELARDPEWVMVNLALLAEHLYNGSGGAEGWSAIFILDGLAELTGLDVPRLKDSLPIGPEDVAPIHLALMSQRREALSAAAATLWQRWFRRPLATIELAGKAADRQSTEGQP